jgi:hypothetical protein
MTKQFFGLLLCSVLLITACSESANNSIKSTSEKLVRDFNKAEKIHKLSFDWQAENEAAGQLAIENLLIQHRFDVERIQLISSPKKDLLNRIKAQSQELMSQDEQLTLIKTIKKISPNGKLYFESTFKSGNSTATYKSKS